VIGEGLFAGIYAGEDPDRGASSTLLGRALEAPHG
jgi:hypothetical protein